MCSSVLCRSQQLTLLSIHLPSTGTSPTIASLDCCRYFRSRNIPIVVVLLDASLMILPAAPSPTATTSRAPCRPVASSARMVVTLASTASEGKKKPPRQVPCAH